MPTGVPRPDQKQEESERLLLLHGNASHDCSFSVLSENREV